MSKIQKPYYAFGTSFNNENDPSLDLIVQGLRLIKQHINESGTWGSDDNLNTLITTNHCTMTLLSVGFSCDSFLLNRAVQYLADLDPNKEISFFWRAGALLNIPKYKEIVRHDANYIWKNRKRIGAHPNYPVPFFLLKLAYFNQTDIEFDFDVKEVVQWIIEDFDETKGWYDKSSITSMACAILFHFEFENKDKIIDASINYLIYKYKAIDDQTGYFDENIVDDCFTIYNLYETSFISRVAESELHDCLKKVYNRILQRLEAEPFLSSTPPFGGNISPVLYPTAVSIRAIISYKSFYDPYYLNKIGNSIVNSFSYFSNLGGISKNSIKPIIEKLKFDYPGKRIAFIMMPFSETQQHIEILSAIKTTLLKYDIVGLRADDKQYADDIFDNILSYMCAADFGIAVFEKIKDQYFNPNVSLEVGFLIGVSKEVCLLKERSLKDLQADLVGRLYRSFDTHNISSSIELELTKWLRDKNLI